MAEPFAETLATVAAGRTALVTRLRAIAARLEALPLDAAEVLILLEPAPAAFERHAGTRQKHAPGAASGSRTPRQSGRPEYG